MARHAHVLIVRERKSDLAALTAGLEASPFSHTVCENWAGVLPALDPKAPNLVLFLCASITAATLDSCRLLKEGLPGTPVVVSTRHFREVYRLRFMELGADELVPEEDAVELLKQIAARLPVTIEEAQKPEEEEDNPKSEMFFRLKPGDLSNALQFLCMSSRVGRLEFRFEGGRKAELYMADNTVVTARFGESRGTRALALMLSAGESEARFFADEKAPEVDNDRPISQLLLESAVLADEMNNASPNPGLG